MQQQSFTKRFFCCLLYSIIHPHQPSTKMKLTVQSSSFFFSSGFYFTITHSRNTISPYIAGYVITIYTNLTGSGIFNSSTGSNGPYNQSANWLSRRGEEQALNFQAIRDASGFQPSSTATCLVRRIQLPRPLPVRILEHAQFHLKFSFPIIKRQVP